MKKTQWIELKNCIKDSLVTFTAMIIFVALGTCLYTGIKWTMDSVQSSIDREYETGKMHDFEINYPYGFEDDFIDDLKTLEDVSAAEGYYETYRFFEKDNKAFHIKIMSLTESIDVPERIEGNLPDAAGEIAVTSSWAEKNGVKIGDVIRLKEGNHDLSLIRNISDGRIGGEPDQRVDELRADEFTVTAIVDAAAYMGTFSAMNGVSSVIPAPIDAVAFVSERSFNEDAYCGYSKILVSCDGLKEYGSFTQEYERLSEEISGKIEAKAEAYSERKNELLLGNFENIKAVLKSTAQDQPILPDAIKPYDAMVLSRLVNYSFSGVNYLKDSFDKMKYTLVLPFVIISVLVCCSAVSRLYFDQKKLIGTKKALGFSSRSIRTFYLIYSETAALLGLITGIALGRYAVLPTVLNSVGRTYRFGENVFSCKMQPALYFSLFQIVFIGVTVLITCYKDTRQNALTLLTGKQHITGKLAAKLDKASAFKRLPLLTKTIIKNCLSEPKRVFATLVGVLGCMALVVSSISMYNNLTGSLKYNFEHITNFNTVVYYDGSERGKSNISNLFDSYGLKYANVYFSMGTVELETGELSNTRIFVVDDAAFYDFFKMYSLDDGKEGIAQNGAWISAACSKYAKITDGNIQFTDSSLQVQNLRVEGTYDFYLMYYTIIVPRSCYESVSGQPCEANAFIADVPSGTEKFFDELHETSGYIHTLDFYQNGRSSYDSITEIALAVTLIYLFISVIIAVFVLLNLFEMLINEKKRELIIMMINGYSGKTAKKYVYLDTIFITAVGVILGLVLGVLLGRLSLSSFNNSATNFLNNVDLAACLIGTCFTFLLTLVLCRIAIRKMNDFSLADIDRA